jgi:myo-inositol-1(or 4)-monophosphatase
LNSEIVRLLELSKETARSAVNKIREFGKSGYKEYSFSSDVHREMKAEADVEVEKLILSLLQPAGLEILSEESGTLKGDGKSDLRFIVDPIDGTVNFVRGITSCSVSIALFDGETPIFGVLGSYPSGEIFWGGKQLGSFSESAQLAVSKIADPLLGVLCTGFPSRFEFDSVSVPLQLKLMSQFGKTRMLGSASQSLLQVAKGSAECYSETEIMLWDVAAGIAILEGAGGRADYCSGLSPNSLVIVADNNLIQI